ncbi:MAG: hypothetical protein PVF33_02700, partial [Candidatus Latescibacterota bacterium]
SNGDGTEADGEMPQVYGGSAPEEPPSASEYNGGIEDDVEVDENRAEVEAGGLVKTVEELAKLGKSAGGREVRGSQKQLAESIDRSIPYTMIVVGDVFLSKGSGARKRMARELRSFLSDNIKTAVVATEELKTQFLFGKRDLFRLVAYLAVVILIYLTVFTHQKQILTFLTGDGWTEKILAAIAVFLLVPIVAYSYGTVSRSFLKLIKIE